MKIKLSVSKEHYQEIKTALETHGIEINENADLVLSEKKLLHRQFNSKGY